MKTIEIDDESYALLHDEYATWNEEMKARFSLSNFAEILLVTGGLSLHTDVTDLEHHKSLVKHIVEMQIGIYGDKSQTMAGLIARKAFPPTETAVPGEAGHVNTVAPYPEQPLSDKPSEGATAPATTEQADVELDILKTRE